MEGRQRKHCHCGKLCRVQTSWTDSNPGRRFLVCPLVTTTLKFVDFYLFMVVFDDIMVLRGRNRGCCFFEWFDPEMCSRSNDIIPGLLKNRGKLEQELAQLRSREKLLWGFLFFSWIMLISMMVGGLRDNHH
ncbi:unnamed protein product [Prunus brigantina]